MKNKYRVTYTITSNPNHYGEMLETTTTFKNKYKIKRHLEDTLNESVSIIKIELKP